MYRLSVPSWFYWSCHQVTLSSRAGRSLRADWSRLVNKTYNFWLQFGWLWWFQPWDWSRIVFWCPAHNLPTITSSPSHHHLHQGKYQCGEQTSGATYFYTVYDGLFGSEQVRNISLLEIKLEISSDIERCFKWPTITEGIGIGKGYVFVFAGQNYREIERDRELGRWERGWWWHSIALVTLL